MAAAKYKWVGYEWSALERLWTYESKWNQYANNPRSDACGIPQAMNNCSYGYNIVVQINWGLDYIYGRYHSPSGALSHYNATYWY